MTVASRSFTTVDDVSPWPQADRVNPTQGELAEERYFTVESPKPAKVL